MGSGSKWGVRFHRGDITREAVRRPLRKSIASLQYPPPERNGAGHPPAGPWGTGVAILRGERMENDLFIWYGYAYCSNVSQSKENRNKTNFQVGMDPPHKPLPSRCGARRAGREPPQGQAVDLGRWHRPCLILRPASVPDWANQWILFCSNLFLSSKMRAETWQLWQTGITKK